MNNKPDNLRIVCATSLAGGEELFSRIGTVTLLPESGITAADVRDADLLATRSKVKINDALLEGSSLRFYGTATAGSDHVNPDALAARGIVWTDAGGSNANSVAEYVLCALSAIAWRDGLDFTGATLGIVGAGHVGSRLAALAAPFGLNTLLNDPPLFDATGDARYLPLESVLAQSDIVSLHVPLIDGGPYPTRGMAGEAFFSRLRPGTTFINASRGEVVDEAALLRAIDAGVITRCVLDVFNREPDIDLVTAGRADIATPHIAGYSYDGRLLGTWMVYEAACRYFGRDPGPMPHDDRGRDPVTAEGSSPRDLYRLLLAAYDPMRDHERMRDLPAGTGIGAHFKQLRNTYPDRLEFGHTPVAGPRDLLERAGALGFKIHS